MTRTNCAWRVWPALSAAQAAEATDVVIGFDSRSAPTVFAVDELDAALRARKYTVIAPGQTLAAAGAVSTAAC